MKLRGERKRVHEGGYAKGSETHDRDSRKEFREIILERDQEKWNNFLKERRKNDYVLV